MIINDLDGYYIVFDTKNWNTELDTLLTKPYWAAIVSTNEHLESLFFVAMRELKSLIL